MSKRTEEILEDMQTAALTVSYQEMHELTHGGAFTLAERQAIRLNPALAFPATRRLAVMIESLAIQNFAEEPPAKPRSY